MLTVTAEELEVLANAIKMRYGIDLTSYEPIAFSRRVARALYKLDCETVFVLWRKILRDDELIFSFLNEVTVGLTELFRNPPLWKYLRDELLPILPAHARLRIWYAGCSTGEEIYTFSIVLHEAGKLLNSQARATDLNTDSLAIAEAGKYDMSLWEQYARNYQDFTKSPYQLMQYAKHTTEYFEFLPFLRQQVKFERFDLTHETSTETFDIIFCRNVLIYFDEIYKLKVLQKLVDSLVPNGFLILGYYDNLPTKLPENLMGYHAGHKIFRKKS